jgi:hypothetical protein
VPDARWEEARRALVDAGLGSWIIGNDGG